VTGSEPHSGGRVPISLAVAQIVTPRFTLLRFWEHVEGVGGASEITDRDLLAFQSEPAEPADRSAVVTL
jgi:hypothetical protein